MKREIIVAEGMFSKLTITLNDDVNQKLALIAKKDNPLAAVEQALKDVLYDFEGRYFEISHAKRGSATPQPNATNGSKEVK